MRADNFVSEIEKKCDALAESGLWPVDKVRPRAWLRNFEKEDRHIAALLLDKFIFYNDELSELLFRAAFNNLGDGLTLARQLIAPSDLAALLSSALFTPVEGENPNRSDSGNYICRMARQVLGIEEHLIVDPTEALEHAANGQCVVFLDDFVGSGDQFLATWDRPYSRSGPNTFREVSERTSFSAIYINLVSAAAGLKNISQKAPSVTVSCSHVIGADDNYRNINPNPIFPINNVDTAIDKFLRKYAPNLNPKDIHINSNLEYRLYGYKKRGLLFGFQDSIPDATLPIFWSKGHQQDWVPLAERK